MSSLVSSSSSSIKSIKPTTKSKRTSLLHDVTSVNVNTYTAGEDGGDLATLAATLAKHVHDSDHKLSEREAEEYLTAIDDESEPKFTFEFKGVSIWLELDESDSEKYQAVIDEFQTLASEPCFDCHATVLYNMDAELLHNGDPDYLQRKLEEVVAKLPSKYILLTPKRLLYFPYPRTADDGQGFGCLMPFFQMSLSPTLVSLFETVKNNFPPDERHGKGVPMRRCKSMNDLSVLDAYRGEDRDVIRQNMSNLEEDPVEPVNHDNSTANHPLTKKGRSGSFHSLQGGKAYTPHLSIAYLDMNRTDIMNEGVCERLVEGRPELMKPVRAKYLSAWWTKGQVKDWRRICKVQLC